MTLPEVTSISAVSLVHSPRDRSERIPDVLSSDAPRRSASLRDDSYLMVLLFYCVRLCGSFGHFQNDYITFPVE